MKIVRYIWLCIFSLYFQADPKLLEAVEGLKPDPEKHQFYIDLQPVSYQTNTYLFSGCRRSENIFEVVLMCWA